MKAFKNIFLVLVSVAFVSGCSTDNYANCDENVAVGVEDVIGPSTATINQTITFDVSFEAGSSCGTFLDFDEVDSATNEKTITVLARYEGCSCTLVPAIRTKTYSFSAPAAGTYVLKFKITNSTFKTITVIVT